MLLRSTATTNSGSSAAPSVSLPTSGVTGDLLFVLISHNDGTLTTADNNGLTPLAEDFDSGNDAGGMGVSIYSRVMTETEPSTLNFTMSGSNRWAITSFIIGEWDGTTKYDVAIDTFDYQLSTTTPSCAEITTITNGAWAIAFLGIDSGTNTITGGPGGSWVEIATVNTQQPLAVYYLEKATAGATGSAGFTVSASTNCLGMRQFAIKPSGTPPVAITRNGLVTDSGVIPT